MKNYIYHLTCLLSLFLLSNVNLTAQEAPPKWRFVANIQDAYRVNYLLPYGSESNYPHQTGWSLGFDRSLLYKNNWNLRLGMSFTKQNEIWSNNRYWNLFEKPIAKRDNQYYAAFPISLNSTRGRKLNTFFQIEPTFNLNDRSDNFVNFLPGIEYKLNRFTSVFFSHGLQIRNFFTTQKNQTYWHSQLGLKMSIMR
ncbi:MAG: hypothetical protein KDC80_25450 [Saprospiraceae bacterium]|nr:hypothetical protein [Saprospiraceae bacterium]